MKRTISLILLLFVISSCFAQSIELRNAYKQVSNTLKEYYFRSGDIYYWVDYAKTKSISLVIQNGYFVFTFNDDYGIAYQIKPEECKQGFKKVKVSIEDLEFADVGVGTAYCWLDMNCVNGFEYSYKNKKEILKKYTIGGKELSLNKLRKELIELRDLVNNEGFKGYLGTTSSSSKKSNSSSTSSQNRNKTKKVGKYVQ